MLSGFVTHYAFRARVIKEPTLVFYARRFRAILPLWMFALIFSAYVKQNLQQWTLINVLYFTGTNTWYSTLTWDHAYAIPGAFPLWTLATLLWLWVAYPFVARALVRFTNSIDMVKNGWLVLLIGVGSLGVVAGIVSPLIWASRGDRLVVHTSPIFNAFRFFPGVLAAEVVLRNPKQKHWAWGVIHDLLWVGVIAMAILHTGGEACHDPINDYAMILTITAIFTVAPFASRSLVLAICNHGLLTKLGNYSFHLYALQAQVVEVWWTFMAKYWHDGPQNVPGGFNFYSYFSHLLLICVVLADCIEQPLQRWLAVEVNDYAKRVDARRMEKVKDIDLESPGLPNTVMSEQAPCIVAETNY